MNVLLITIATRDVSLLYSNTFFLQIGSVPSLSLLHTLKPTSYAIAEDIVFTTTAVLRTVYRIKIDTERVHGKADHVP